MITIELCMSVEWIYRDDLHQVSSGGLEMKTVSGASCGNGWECCSRDYQEHSFYTKMWMIPSSGPGKRQFEDLLHPTLQVVIVQRWQHIHSKHGIVDDTCCNIGNQNLYDCDLAELGVVIDDEAEVASIILCTHVEKLIHTRARCGCLTSHGCVGCWSW